MYKPAYLRLPNDPARKPPAITLNLEVMMGTQLPKPDNSSKGEIIDPFVLSVCTMPTCSTQAPTQSAVDTTAEKKLKTNVVDNNGFSLS